MARSARTLPGELRGQAFFRTSRARELGVSRRVIASLAHPHHGVLGHHAPQTVEEDVCALALVLPPGCVISHVTAARLHRLPLPTRWRPGERIDVGRRSGTPPRARTVRGHRLAESVRTVRMSGVPVPVVAVEDLFGQLAQVLGHRDLVALGDLAVGRESTRALPDLESGLRAGAAGVVTARAALADVLPGAASAMESYLRQDVVLAGAPEPELNAPIYDEEGTLVAVADLLWRRHRLIVEYNGLYHVESAAQRRRDEARRNRLECLGYRVIVVNRDDYYERHAETMDAILVALAEQAVRLGL